MQIVLIIYMCVVTFLVFYFIWISGGGTWLRALAWHTKVLSHCDIAFSVANSHVSDLLSLPEKTRTCVAHFETRNSSVSIFPYVLSSLLPFSQICR